MNSAKHAPNEKSAITAWFGIWLGTWAVATAALFLSCAKTPELAPPVAKPTAAGAVANPEERVNPKLDILFVIDNAEAMKDHQDNLSDNIDKFAEVFKTGSAGGNLDFHIGVTSLFDRTRWVKGQPDCDFDDGQLRTLKHVIPASAGSATTTEEVLDGSAKTGQGYRNFVTNQDVDVIGLLKDTLKLGEQPFHKCGYKFEEEFGPVKAALAAPMLTGANQGFYRPDAHLAVIIVSDADDETSDMTADQMKQVLVQAKNGQLNRVSIVAVTTSADATDSSCPRDNDGPPVKLHELVDKMQGQYLNLCDADFGTKLANIAQSIRQKALTHVIPLTVTPDLNTIEVHYGNQLVAPGPSGWIYDQNTKSILFNGDFEIQGDPNAKITIDYVGIDMQGAFDSDRVHIVGQ